MNKDLYELIYIFFKKLYIGYEFEINNIKYNILKGKKLKGINYNFIVQYTDNKTNITKTFPIKYNGIVYTAYSYTKRKTFNPLSKMIRDLEGLLILDSINYYNPLHNKSEVLKFIEYN